MWNSWSKSQKTFILLLLIISLFHMGSLLLQLKVIDSAKPTLIAKTRPPIKVTFDKVPQGRARNQIVESEDGKKQKVDGAYLSDKDRAFDKQTLARKVDPFKKGDKSTNAPQGIGKGTSGGAAQKPQPKTIAKNKSKGPKGKSLKGMKLSDLGAHVGQPDPFMEAAQAYTNKKNGKPGGGQIARAVSSTNDHVEEVPLGDMTHLNTIEYKYYGFYHRIKQRLEQFWGRSIQEKAQQLAKLGRQVASDDEHVTSLQITMNHEGEVVDIRIVGSSGVKELDDAAIESFNQAGPFPNPPKGLIKDGLVVIEWGFVVNT